MDANDLLDSSNGCTAYHADNLVSAKPGYYAVFLDTPESLPEPFKGFLQERRTNLIYVGIATGSLRKRLVDQDLRGKSNSTFFRSIGAIRGLPAQPGSGGPNGRNYKFATADANELVTWINEHLCVRWFECPQPSEDDEKRAIRKLRPLLNIKHNPGCLQKLKDLRRERRMVARDQRQ